MGRTEAKAYVDATGVFRWAFRLPDGLQRVEMTICAAGLEKPDVGFVAMDVLGRYYELSRADRAYLEFLLSDEWQNHEGGFLSRVTALLSHFPAPFRYPNNETSRRMAYVLLGSQEGRGAAFWTLKAALRAFQWGYIPTRHLLAVLNKGPLNAGRPRERAGPAGRAVVLVSSSVNFYRRITTALQRAGLTGVYVVHDLISVDTSCAASAFSAERTRAFLRRILEAPNPIITVSRSTREDLLKWNEAVVRAPYPYAIEACPLGSSFIPVDEDDEPIPALAGRRFAVFCSSFFRRKNHALLVAVWRRLAKRLTAEQLPDLVLIGREGDGLAKVEEELAADAVSAARVHILMDTTDSQLRWACRNACLGLYPSSAEGWGLPVSECLAYGLPVIHSDVPALNEAAQGTMPTPPAGDIDAWEAVLFDLLAAPEKLEALRRTALDRYDREGSGAFGERILAHLQGLAQNGLRSPDAEEDLKTESAA